MSVRPGILFPNLGTARLASGPLTAGSILFADASGAIAQDNASLFWNDSLNRLGVGTNSPQAVGHYRGVQAALTSAYGAVIYEDATPIADRQETGGKADFRGIFNTAGDFTSAGQFGAKKVNQTSGDFGFDMFFSPRRNGVGNFEERMRIKSTGNVGIAFDAPDNRLTVHQDVGGTNVFGAYTTAGANYARWQLVQDSVETTDATLTTVLSIAIATSRVYWLRAYIIGRRTGGTSGAVGDSAVYILTAAYRNDGTLVQIGSATVDFQAEDQAAWDANFVASGGSVLVRVTGAAGNTVKWHCTLNYGYINV